MWGGRRLKKGGGASVGDPEVKEDGAALGAGGLCPAWGAVGAAPVPSG